MLKKLNIMLRKLLEPVDESLWCYCSPYSGLPYMMLTEIRNRPEKSVREGGKDDT